MAGAGEDRDALRVLHREHRDGERHDQLDHGGPGKPRHIQVGRGEAEQRAGRRLELAQ